MTNFKGKAIYNPQGKAAEYSKWAVNFYNGCSAKCEYCYNRHGITAKVLGADVPTLKKCLKNEEYALAQFIEECNKNIPELRKHGLFFNFVSDPFLPETIELNIKAISYCILKDIPVKILTKQTWFMDEKAHGFSCRHFIEPLTHYPNLIAFGFTLTGHDELEPGAATNEDRIRAIKVLNDEGFKTWASIEPIISINGSLNMIEEVCNHVDLIKVGLQSGKKYDVDNLKSFVGRIWTLADVYGFKVYLKDSLVKAIDTERELLPKAFCVSSDYNIFES